MESFPRKVGSERCEWPILSPKFEEFWVTD